MTDEYKVFRASDQRELARQIATDLNEIPAQERHAVIAAAVLTSDWLTAHDFKIRAEALRAAAEKWKPHISWTEGAVTRVRSCPTCEHPMHRETVGMVCQTCGKDYMDD